MNCPKCGNELAPNTEICEKCKEAVAQPAPSAPQKQKKGKKNLALKITAIVLAIIVFLTGGLFITDAIIFSTESKKGDFVTDFPILKQKTDLLVYDAEKFPYENYNIKVDRFKTGKVFKSSTFSSFENIINEQSNNPIFSIDFKEDGKYQITLEGIVAERTQAVTESTTKKEELKTIVIIVIVDNDNEKAVDKVTINSKKDEEPIKDFENVISSQGSLEVQNITTIAAGMTHSVGLKNDGTVVATGWNEYGQCEVGDWKDIVSISAGDYFTVGLKSDGTVVSTCSDQDSYSAANNWTDIVAISARGYRFVGLKSDGTVVAVGKNTDGIGLKEWKNIVSISTSSGHIVGLKSDGTVVATGWNEYGQCDVDSWENIIAVAASYECTYGLKSDGTIVFTNAHSNRGYENDLKEWKDIKHIAAGLNSFLGIKSDGTVVGIFLDNFSNEVTINSWTNIVALSLGCYHCVGLKSDGTVVVVGNNAWGECDVSDWKDIKVPGKTDSQSASDTQVPSGEKTDKPADTKEENGVAEWEYSDNFLPAEITAEYDQNTKMVDKVIFEISIPKSYEGHDEMLATYEELSDYMSSDKSFSADFLDETDYTTVVISFDDLSGDSRSNRVALLSEFIGAQYPPEDYYVSYDYLNDALTAEGFTKK